MDLKGTYYRWTSRTAEGIVEDEVVLVADILGSDTNVVAHPDRGTVEAEVPNRPMNPDEARMIGVRLIEAAALADNGRSIRRP